MYTHGLFTRNQRVSRWLMVALAVLLVLASAPRCPGEQSTTTAVITDRAELAASDQFGMLSQVRLADTGDVFFASGGNTALFRWSQAAGTRSRLLQTNDPLDVLGLALPEEYAGSLLDGTGMLLQVNAAGHAAFVASAAIKGERDPAAVFVYDGSSYRLVDTSISTFTQVLLNNRDRVAVLGASDPLNVGPMAIYVETDSGVVNVAEQNQPVPPNPAGVTGTIGSFLQLVGFNDAGQLAFLANIQNGNVNRALFLFDGQSLRLVAGSGGSVGGNFSLPTGTPQYGVNYALDGGGRVAFFSSKGSEQPAIWIGDASESPKKLVGLGESSGVTEWGNCAASLWLRGFNDAGKVLYDCNTAGGPNYALFLKALTDPVAQVVFHRGQPGGPKGETFYVAEQAMLNNPGKVVFLARSANYEWGWYLGSAAPAPPLT